MHACAESKNCEILFFTITAVCSRANWLIFIVNKRTDIILVPRFSVSFGHVVVNDILSLKTSGSGVENGQTHEIYSLCDIDATSESRKFDMSICHFLTNRKRPFFLLANKSEENYEFDASD